MILKKLFYFFWRIVNIVELQKSCKVGSGFICRGKIRIITRAKGRRCIEIGDNVTINSGGWSNPVWGGEQTFLYVVGAGKIVIGDSTGISNTIICSANSVTIEEYVTIGAGCKIWDTDFHSVDFVKRASGHDTACSKPIRIMKHAFIGAGCIVLKGVTIGEKAVIGAGSVVTRDIPANEIWAGNPAVFIRKI